jgi:short-subunit dehydrogenase
MVEVNLVGTLNGMQLALPRMLARGQGHVVNVASTAGKIGVMGGSVYCATKHAVVGLSEAVRAELGDTPVCISVVMPGPVNTELAHGISGVRGVGLIEPEEVAAAVVGALGSRRFEVFVPGVAGVMLRALAVLPRRVRDPLERAGRMHDAFTRVDEDARASYEERVAGRSTA